MKKKKKNKKRFNVNDNYKKYFSMYIILLIFVLIPSFVSSIYFSTKYSVKEYNYEDYLNDDNEFIGDLDDYYYFDVYSFDIEYPNCIERSNYMECTPLIELNSEDGIKLNSYIYMKFSDITMTSKEQRELIRNNFSNTKRVVGHFVDNEFIIEDKKIDIYIPIVCITIFILTIFYMHNIKKKYLIKK